jgi:YidC/Oxa1 family membrane protein insertase
MKIISAIAWAAAIHVGSAFAPSPHTTCSRHRKTAANNMVMHDMGDLHSLNHLTTMITSSQHLLAQASTWIADSSAVAVDASDAAAVAAAEDIGWWESYIQLYKNGLAFVHDNIVDEPLKKAGFTQTWGVSIFLFTAGVRSLLIPFSISQNKSSEYMKALKPYTKKIKEKYSDKDMQNRAISKLYQDAEQNPLGGCITSFAQIPIFLGLYRSVTRLAAEGRLDEPFLWIPTLEGPVSAENNYRGMEWLTEGWVNGAPSMGWEATLPFLVMPVVLVLMQTFTMNVLQQPEDESATEEEKEQLKGTKRVLKFLPLMIGFFSLQVPAGLTIYWFTSNLFTVSQSLIIRGYYAANPPKIELPDYWDALDKGDQMTADEKREAAMAGLSTGPSFNQLLDEAKFHYIVKREPLRDDSKAWNRVESSGMGKVPEEMKAWVGNAPAPAPEAASVVVQNETAPVA